jgi:hypothetical protein
LALGGGKKKQKQKRGSLLHEGKFKIVGEYKVRSSLRFRVEKLLENVSATAQPMVENVLM